MSEKEKKTKEHKHEESKQAAEMKHNPEAARKELEAVQKELETALHDKEDIFGQLQRVSADYSNFQKRMPKQIEERVTYEKENLVRNLLGILDNFEHAMDKTSETEETRAVLDGIRMVYDQMLGVLRQMGLEQIASMGEHFDPSMHAAIMQKSEPDKEDNIIVEEFAKGYKFNGRVLRPSRVAVNKIQKHEKQEAEEATEDSQAQGEDEPAEK